MGEPPDLIVLYERLLRVTGQAEGVVWELAKAVRQTQRLVAQSDALLRQARRAQSPNDRFRLN
jgi:hypothetical protein